MLLPWLLVALTSRAASAAVPNPATALVPESLSLTTDAVAPRRFFAVQCRRASIHCGRLLTMAFDAAFHGRIDSNYLRHYSRPVFGWCLLQRWITYLR